MNRFRVSKSLTRHGVPPKKQLLIYAKCINGEERERIKELSGRVAGIYSDALYEFLTNSRINHNYIYIKYGIERNALFKLKRSFYIAWTKAEKSIDNSVRI